MIFNETLHDPSFEPFLNISKYYLIAWSVINFLKCLYFTISITNKRLPPSAVTVVFIGMTVVYFTEPRAYTWWLPLQLLDLLLIVYTIVPASDGIFLLALLSNTTHFLKPFAFIIDLFVILFMAIDFLTVNFENTPFWTMLYVNCVFVSMPIAKMNSHGADLYKAILNSLYVCLFWSVTWSARDRTRVIPVFITIVVCVLQQFNREEPMRFDSTEFSKLTSNVFKVDWY